MKTEKKTRKMSGIKSFVAVFIGIVFSCSILLAAPKVSFAGSCAGVDTALIDCSASSEGGGGIFYILSVILNILTFGVGAAGVLGIVISGIQYMTAAGNEVQMTKAKNRIVQVVIGLAAYGLLWAFLEWLIPGGIL